MTTIFHFLNLERSDCTIVHFPEKSTTDNMTIDERIVMVNSCHPDEQNDYQKVVDYYKENFRDHEGSLKPIFHFACKRPHQDQKCNIKDLFVNSGIRILNFWNVENSFDPKNSDQHRFHEDPLFALTPFKKLSPHSDNKQSAFDQNIDGMSYPIAININDRKAVLAGDAKAIACWGDIYNNCKEDLSNTVVLKAGHYLPSDSYYQEAIRLMNPSLIIFSNSMNQGNEDSVERLYKNAAPNALILKTWKDGHIKVDVPFDFEEPIAYYTSK